jgi:4-carboxymuconolactone decarboxylase
MESTNIKCLVRRTLLLGVVLSAVPMAQAPAENRDAKIEVVSPRARTVSPGSTENFTGRVQVEQLFAAQSGRQVSGGTVTFKPGARSVWHTHPKGQILIVTAGTGLVQQWGEAIQTIRTGDIVWIPPGVKHWHGATARTSMTHIAIQEALDGKVVDWMELVSDEQYSARRGK